MEWQSDEALPVGGFSLQGPRRGAAFCVGRQAKCPSLVTKRRDCRDVEVHLEFMVAKGPNSGVIFHGNHEIQILDSHHVEKPTVPPAWMQKPPRNSGNVGA